jgi:hypothetical protein
MDSIDIATATPEGRNGGSAGGVVRTKAERRAIFLETLVEAKPDRRVWTAIQGMQFVIVAFSAMVVCVALVAGVMG